MVHEPRGRLLVLAAHLVEVAARHAVDQHHRHVLCGEERQRPFEGARGRRQQQPVDAPFEQRLHHPQLLLGILARVAEQQRVAGAACLGLDGGDEVGEVGVRQTADDEAERLRARPRQRAGDRVRRVARAIDGLHHALRGGCARRPRPVEDVRDRRDRHAGQAGDVLHGDHVWKMLRNRLRASACGITTNRVAAAPQATAAHHEPSSPTPVKSGGPVNLHPDVLDVTDRIAERSAETRSAYLERIRAAAKRGPARGELGCANLAHGFAACGPDDKLHLRAQQRANVAIVSSYNDMLSAHQPLERYPAQLKRAIAKSGGVAQFAGGVPAMCDGITQGRSGMELSLFSRDVVAMATAVALSHDMFDGALLLGVCDKIVPGLLIGALSFGQLPVVLVPAGPMPSGLSNKEKSGIRQLHAEGKVGQEALLDAESAAYHAPGTCTFFGTANTNQLVVEAMGLHLPGASFVSPGTPLRKALTEEAARRVLGLTALEDGYTPVGELVDEKTVVNAVVALLASGGSTNHTMHLVAIAAAAGIRLTWDDFADLSPIVPLLASIYPNGAADINHFQAAGGTPFLIGQLLDAGLMHRDVRTVAGPGLDRYREEPYLDDAGELRGRPSPAASHDESVLRPAAAPFAPDGGIRVLGARRSPSSSSHFRRVGGRRDRPPPRGPRRLRPLRARLLRPAQHQLPDPRRRRRGRRRADDAAD